MLKRAGIYLRTTVLHMNKSSAIPVKRRRTALGAVSVPDDRSTSMSTGGGESGAASSAASARPTPTACPRISAPHHDGATGDWVPPTNQCLASRYKNNITKSPNDPKQYRVIKLQNGLTALLIADAEVAVKKPNRQSGFSGGTGKEAKKHAKVEAQLEDKSQTEKLSAAALCVGVGSFSDPLDIPGLAHFLEHMVFMGSQKYPDENEFDNFVKVHGGNSNAYTECERTVFYFDIKRSHFLEGLDRFAQFFTSPLMKPSSVDREIEAIDSEFSQSKPSDTSRFEQLLSSLAKDGHPMNKFMWGNSQTLKETPAKVGIDIYERLQEFYKDHYSTEFMTLAIQSRHSLDALEEFVLSTFADASNNSLRRPTFWHLKDPFSTEHFRKLYKVVPVKNTNKVEITWSLPTQLEHYRVKPLHYIGWLVGHEGKGSILAYLRNRLWAVDLYGGNSEGGFEHNTTLAAFSIGATLTEDGLQHLPEVLTVIFEYLEILRRTGPNERVFREIQTIEDNEFLWLEQTEPVDYVENTCANMLLYPPMEYLTGDRLVSQYDSKVIAACQDQLIPTAANISVHSKKFAADGTCTERESWYQTEYSVSDIPEDWLEKWTRLDPRAELHLPEENTYIATDFTMKTPDVANSEFPMSVTDTDVSRLWYKMDNKFRVPKAYVFFNLLSPNLKNSVESATMLDLFLRILDYNLSEMAYAADVAQLLYSVKGFEHGLLLKVNGFNHKLKKSFETIVNHIADFDTTEETFETMVKQQKKSYYNNCIKPDVINKDLRLIILRPGQEWTEVDQQRVLSTVTKDGLMAWVRQLVSRVYVQGLAQGNITVKEAKEYEDYLITRLQCKPLREDERPETRVLELPLGAAYCRVQNFNPKDENSVIVNYYQHGPATLHQYCLNELLIMRMEEPCFDILRTREQLGYSVYCANRVTDGILAFSITVCSQATKFSMEILDKKMEAFLVEFGESCDAMTEEEFETLKNSLLNLKRCEDSNLGEEVDRNWSEILSQTHSFNRLTREISEISSITLSGLREWFHSLTSRGERCRKLSLQVQGHPSAKTPGTEAMEREENDGEAEDSDEMEEGSEEEGDSDEEDDSEEEEDDEDRNDHDLDLAPTEFIFLPVLDKAEIAVISDVEKFTSRHSLYPVSRIT